ncbi:MAG: hemolysin III family protein [Acidimicrobiales bacterium]|nr:hemolysin III family protein [Acidimicrobiales bacterium]
MLDTTDPDLVKPLLRGRSHEYAFFVALTLAPIMIAAAPGVRPRLVIALYVAAITGLFGISALYHRVDWAPKARSRMKRLDHSMIFIAIAGTYTPIAVFALSPGVARVVLPVVWIGALVGIVVRNLWPDAPKPLAAAPYVAVGWVAVFVMFDMWSSLGVAGFTLVAVGGLLYTFGAAVYALRRPNPWPHHFGYHEIFHLFVIGGAALHYVSVAFVAIPKA